MENRERSEDMSGPVEYWLLGTVPADKQMNPMRSGVNGGLRKETKKEMKPVTSISVGSADEHIEKIKKLGGKIIVPKQEVTRALFG
jgi:predicted enzyme related to lactoylglutathione lyase